MKRGVDQGGKDGPVITPMQMRWEMIEDKLRQMGFTAETISAAAAAYGEQRDADGISRI